MAFSLRKRDVQVAIITLFLLTLLVRTLQRESFEESLFDSSSQSRKQDGAKVHSPFDEQVDKILTKKKVIDRENTYWLVDTKITRSQTQSKVPKYFYGPSWQKPVIGPFDPRFTLAIYYNYISHHPEALAGKKVQFHWSDWVDMTPLNKFLFSADKNKFKCSDFDSREYQKEKWPQPKKRIHMGALDPAEYCHKPSSEDESGLGFVITKPFGRMVKKNAILLGKSYLYTSAPNPSSIVFLAREGTYPIDLERTKTPLIKGDMVSQYLATKEGKSKQINTLDEFKLLESKVPAVQVPKPHRKNLQLNHEDFIYDADAILEKLDKSPPSNVSLENIQNYKTSVMWSKQRGNDPPKYFHEASIFDTVVGEHYDWRFFSGVILNTQEQANALHRMVRSWLAFTRKVGIITWVAHGSLLSWYWNGMAFPWDNDIDVQMPVMELHKLSLKFNQSLVIEDGTEGFGRFLVECGSSISTRGHSNGLNNIDARFIDIDSGLYIDITGLAVSPDPTPDRYIDSLPKDYIQENHPREKTNNLLQVYNCRNRHFASLTELSPLIKTFVDGEIAYVPNRFSDILSNEYNDGGLLQKYYAGRLYIPKFRLWIPQDLLLFFMRHRTQWNSYYDHQNQAHEDLTAPKTDGNLTHKEIQQLLGLAENDYLDILLADDLLQTYIMTREFTAIHEEEMVRLIFGKSTSSLVDDIHVFKPSRYEPFLFKLNKYFITFEARLGTFEKLHRKFLQETAQYGGITG